MTSRGRWSLHLINHPSNSSVQFACSKLNCKVHQMVLHIYHWFQWWYQKINVVVIQKLVGEKICVSIHCKSFPRIEKCFVKSWLGKGLGFDSHLCLQYVCFQTVVSAFLELWWKRKKKSSEKDETGNCSSRYTVGSVCSVTAAISIWLKVTNVPASVITIQHPNFPIHGYPIMISCPDNLVTFKQIMWTSLFPSNPIDSTCSFYSHHILSPSVPSNSDVFKGNYFLVSLKWYLFVNSLSIKFVINPVSKNPMTGTRIAFSFKVRGMWTLFGDEKSVRIYTKLMLVCLMKSDVGGYLTSDEPSKYSSTVYFTIYASSSFKLPNAARSCSSVSLEVDIESIWCGSFSFGLVEDINAILLAKLTFLVGQRCSPFKIWVFTFYLWRHLKHNLYLMQTDCITGNGFLLSLFVVTASISIGTGKLDDGMVGLLTWSGIGVGPGLFGCWYTVEAIQSPQDLFDEDRG